MALISLLGGVNIVMGFVSIVFYSIIVGIKVPMYQIGCGLWVGALLVVAGAMGVYAGKAKHRMSYSLAILTAVIALIADIAGVALAVYVYYYLIRIYPDRADNMPIYQVYMAFHTLWFLTVLAAFFTALLQVKTGCSKMPESGEKGEVFMETRGQHQPPPNQGAAYQPAPRPYYY